ncbi:hypothetical protein [Paenibacillus sp. GCM10012303]|jgi:hypothetical protein|uniref:hypothetical protein n=1 Tax=Paenibacillus sp. GCM10012303 TaxID=3317340 RepID=UPI00360812BA
MIYEIDSSIKSCIKAEQIQGQFPPTFARLFFLGQGREIGGRQEKAGESRFILESYLRGFYQTFQGFSGVGMGLTEYIGAAEPLG